MLTSHDAQTSGADTSVWRESYELIGQEQRQRSVEAGVKFVDISRQEHEAILRYVILSLQPPPKV